MAQTTFSNGPLTQWQIGQITQPSNPFTTRSKSFVDTVTTLSYGRFTQYTNAAQTIVSNLYGNSATMSLTAALVASDVFTGNAVINSVTYALTSTTYATSNAATLAAIAAKYAALTGVASATVVSNTIVVVFTDGYDGYLSGSTVTSGGAGTAVASETNTNTKTIAAPYVQEERAPDGTGSSNDVYLSSGRTASLLFLGSIALYTVATLNPGDTPYVIFSGTNRGLLTNAAGAGTAPAIAIALSGWSVTQGVTGAGIVEVSAVKAA